MTVPNQTTHGIPEDARNWAMACHLMALTGLIGNGIGLLLGPLITWLVKKDLHPFIDEHGKEAVNFQLTMLIAIIICVPLIFVIIGLPLLIMIGILSVVMPIIGGIKASHGDRYEYPLSIRFIR